MGYAQSVVDNKYASGLSTTNNRGDINFTLSSETTFDEAIRMSFRESATTEYDVDDAGKIIPLLSEYAIMSFDANNQLKAVESLPYNLQDEITIPMRLQLAGISADLTFAWNGFESIPEDWYLYFHDYQKGVSLNMRTESEYNFFAEDESQFKANIELNRFGITIRPDSIKRVISGEVGWWGFRRC